MLAVHGEVAYSLLLHTVQLLHTGLEFEVQVPDRYWFEAQEVVHGKQARLAVERHGEVS